MKGITAVISSATVNHSDNDKNSDSDYRVDSISLSSQVKNESDEECDDIALQNETPAPNFGNISVMNSADVHFGNKTVYQGPVTIKQFLYSNGRTSGDSAENSDGDEKVSVEIRTSGAVNDGFVKENGTDDVNSGVKDVEKRHVIQDSDYSNARGCQDRLRKGFIWLQNLPKQSPVEVFVFLAVVLILTVVIIVVLFLKYDPVSVSEKTKFVSSLTDTDEQDKNTPTDYNSDIINSTLRGKLRIVSRLQWLAQPPIEPANPLPTPVPLVIIQHTATENCLSQAQCVFQVRHIQTFHIESNNFWDIGYNFLVGGDGAVYEGRGWKSEGAHTFGYNSRSIGIGFIGTFLKEKPPLKQIEACKKLIATGVELGYIGKDYKLLAARQLSGTESPGEALFNDMKTWPHWSNEV